MKKINIYNIQTKDTPTERTQRSQVSNSPKNYEKTFSTLNKPEYLFLSGNDDKLTFSPRIKNKIYSSTVQFYQNEIRLKANKCTFSDLLQWQLHCQIFMKGDYDKIEMDQSIIQYFFPSLQGGQGDIDSEQFRNSPELAKKIIEAYKLILDYYGITLSNEVNGDLIFSENYKERLEKTLFNGLSKSVHAYRIKRMLNFLSKTGFIVYCHKFIEFMKDLIKVNQNQVKKPIASSTENNNIKSQSAPILSHLNDVYESDWKKYDQYDLNNEMQQKMLKNQSIFIEQSKYTKSVLLQQLENKQQV